MRTILLLLALVPAPLSRSGSCPRSWSPWRCSGGPISRPAPAPLLGATCNAS